jgi:uncharacterized protein
MDVLFVKADRKFDYETIAIASRRAAGLFPPPASSTPPDWAAFTSKTFDGQHLFRGSPSSTVSPICKMPSEQSPVTSERIGTEPANAVPRAPSRMDTSPDPDEGFAITMNEIREWKGMLRLCVPEYMVPAIFMRVDALPLTDNNKINRKALPEPTLEDLQLNHNRSSANFVPPVGTTQTQIALMWGELLHMTDVSADDDFFEAGGHSLLTMQLAMSINTTFGIRLPLAKIAAHSRLDKLAALVDAACKGGVASSEVAPVARGANLPAQAIPQVQIEVVSPQDLPTGAPDVVPHIPVPMADGTDLSAKLWLPRCAAPGPAVVEINPYRKGDGTVEIDALTFPYLAAHGHPCARVDSRGSGDSGGDLDDEYSTSQIDDAAAIVAWTAKQPWCNGQVVLFGVSWSGFIAMQVAALEAPPAALCGVISVCATDSRFADDMHFQGGALLTENLSWSSWLMHTLSQPPDPLTVGAGWLERWRVRASALQPLAPKWMGHSTEDLYWSAGSVKHRYDCISVPMLLVGGTHGGGYHNSIARMAEACTRAPVTAVVGPWSHNMPHTSPLGPQTGFLQDCVDWLAALATPAAGSFAAFAEAPSHGRPLANAAATLCGRWLRFPSASAAAGAAQEHLFGLSEGGKLEPLVKVQATGCRTLVVDGTIDHMREGNTVCGSTGGRWFTFGANADLPTEQSADDAVSTLFELSAAAEDTLILGRPAVTLVVTDGASCSGHAVARLVAVAPNGIAHRITWGVLHVGKAAAAGSALTIEMQYTCYTLPKGYRMRLALSRDYFPVVWPDVQPAAKAPLPIQSGASFLCIAQAPCSAVAIAAALDAASEAGAVTTTVCIPAGSDVSRTGCSAGRRVVSQQPGMLKVEVCGGGAVVDLGAIAAGLLRESVCNEVYELREEEGTVVPVHEVEWKTTGRRQGKGAIDSECCLVARMQGGADALVLTHRLEVRNDREVVFAKCWEHRVDAATI